MFKALSARRIGAVALVGALAAPWLAAQAQVNKCPQADGSVSYQSTPCDVGEARAERVSAAQLNAAQRAKEARAHPKPAAASGAHARPRASKPASSAR